MGKSIKIDSTDKKIIYMLSENARRPFLEIARACGMSGAAIHQRVNKLEESGIITGSRIQLSPINMGYSTCAFVGVFLDQANLYHKVIKELDNIPEIVESHYTTGNYTIFLKVYCKNNQDLMSVLNGRIQNISGIASTETFISLEQGINRELMP